MEWWKLFSGTFVLIFLAELGDKTQLAALAKTADSPDGSWAKWVVFLGASLALVTSTFIAVFLGHALKTVVPDERYIRLAAGGLFLVFGFLILWETYRSFQGETAKPPPTTESAPATGLVGALALRAAMDFESLAAERYRKLARTAEPRFAALLLELAGEEEGHLARLHAIPEPAADIEGAIPGETGQPTITADDHATLAELVAHEKATADFYQNLAERTRFPAARAVFAKLAEEEGEHARRLGSISDSIRIRKPVH